MSIPTFTIRRLAVMLAVQITAATAILAVTIGLATAPATRAADLTSSRYGPTDGWYSYVTSLTSTTESRYGPRDGWYPYVVSRSFQQLHGGFGAIVR